MESIPFTIATKIIKYLKTNLPKETKELYTENCKTLIKELKDNKQMERYSMFLSRKNQYCENDYPTKCNLQIQCNPYQFTNGIFHRTRTKKFHSSYGNTVLRIKSGAGGSTFLTSDYTTNLLVIKTAWYWHKTRNIDQRNKTESPEINLCIYGYLIFYKGGKNI